MSCANEPATFRLLDHLVGWDTVSAKDLSGLDGGGVQLEWRRPGAIERDVVDRCILPPRLARGCDPCEWYLVTPPAPRSRLLRRDACDREWRSAWDAWCPPAELVDAVAVAARRDRVAVAEQAAGRVWLWRRSGSHLVATIAIDEPRALAFTASGDLLVVAGQGQLLHRFDPAGMPRGSSSLAPAVDEGRRLERLAVGSDHAIWVVTEQGGDLQLWQQAKDHRFTLVTDGELLGRAFASSPLSVASDRGFCTGEAGDGGDGVARCYSWYGRPVEQQEVAPAPSPRFLEQGQLLTEPIDSGIPRCRWHRIRIDADVPKGTSIELAVSTSDVIDVDPSSHPAEPLWSNFPSGTPHPHDWWSVPRGVFDALIDQPAGRYLHLRLRLIGNGYDTPVVRRIRLDFPRATSLDLLPSAYAELPEARDFGERFMTLFDAAIEEIDQAIERFPALLDPVGVPEDVLPWIGRFLAIALDPAWEPDRRRKILGQASELYRKRGTVAGLRQAIEAVFDVDPAVREPAQMRQWGTLSRERNCSVTPSRGRARIGDVRLFGRARARFRVGTSALRTAPLRSYGDPQQDPFLADAFRLEVLIPPTAQLTAAARQRLTQLVASQVPAHVVASVRFGAPSLVVGRWSAVGVDTRLGAPPPPVLGKGLHLQRMSVLWPSRRGTKPALRVGEAAAVGINTIME